MTQIFWALPEIHAKDKKPEKKVRRKGYDYAGTRAIGTKPTRDYWAIIMERLEGATWQQIADKHGFSCNSTAWQVVMNSKAAKRLTPEHVESLNENWFKAERRIQNQKKKGVK